MRIIAGKWGGRRLQAPANHSTRPTTDRVRESLFSSLHSQLGSFDGLHVLDVFAGSGALGLEALSRGALRLTAIESDPRTAQLVKDNYAKLSDNSDHADFQLYQGDIFKLISRLHNLGADLIFLDPPYDLSDKKLHNLLIKLGDAKTFSLDALVVIERAKSAKSELFLPENFTIVKSKTIAETALYFTTVAQ